AARDSRVALPAGELGVRGPVHASDRHAGRLDGRDRGRAGTRPRRRPDRLRPRRARDPRPAGRTLRHGRQRTVSPRTAAETAWLQPRLGVALALAFHGPSGYFEDADLVPAPNAPRPAAPIDLATAASVDAAVQFLVDRLKTQQGELAPLGHPE